MVRTQTVDMQIRYDGGFWEGFNTPGPDYRPHSPYWGRGPEKSFGLKLEDEDPTTPGPGRQHC